MTLGRRITGVVLVGLAILLAVTSIFVPWMLQERAVQDCSAGPCENEVQDLTYGTMALRIEGDEEHEFVYDDVQALADLRGDDVPGLLTIDIGLYVLVGAAATLGLGLVLGLIGLAGGRGVSMTGGVFSAIGATTLVVAMVLLVVGITAFSGEAEDMAVDGRVVEDEGLVAAYGVGLTGAAFFAGLFGAILLPAPPAAYQPSDHAMYVPASEADTGQSDGQAGAGDAGWDDAAWQDTGGGADDAVRDDAAWREDGADGAEDAPGGSDGGWEDAWEDADASQGAKQDAGEAQKRRKETDDPYGAGWGQG